MGCATSKAKEVVDTTTPVKHVDITPHLYKSDYEPSPVSKPAEEHLARSKPAEEPIKVDASETSETGDTAKVELQIPSPVQKQQEQTAALLAQQAIASALLTTSCLPDSFYAGLGMAKLGRATWSSPPPMVDDATSRSATPDAKKDAKKEAKGAATADVPSSPLTADTRSAVPATPPATPPMMSSERTSQGSSGFSPPTTTISTLAAATSLPPPKLPKALLDAPAMTTPPKKSKPSEAGSEPSKQPTSQPTSQPRKGSKASKESKGSSDTEETASAEWIEAHLKLANTHQQRSVGGKKGKKKRSTAGGDGGRGGSITISLAGGSGGRAMK